MLVLKDAVGVLGPDDDGAVDVLGVTTHLVGEEVVVEGGLYDHVVSWLVVEPSGQWFFLGLLG